MNPTGTHSQIIKSDLFTCLVLAFCCSTTTFLRREGGKKTLGLKKKLCSIFLLLFRKGDRYFGAGCQKRVLALLFQKNSTSGLYSNACQMMGTSFFFNVFRGDWGLFAQEKILLWKSSPVKGMWLKASENAVTLTCFEQATCYRCFRKSVCLKATDSQITGAVLFVLLVAVMLMLSLRKVVKATKERHL